MSIKIATKFIIIQTLDSNKAHGHDGMTLKLCSSSIIKSLSLIFQNCLNSGTFPVDGEKDNIVSAHKKNNKQLVNNYCPVSLLPICSKMFEKLIFGSIFVFLKENKLLNSEQSGFTENGSCIYQLVSVTHNIFEAFDTNSLLQVRRAFVDFSEALERVWH